MRSGGDPCGEIFAKNGFCRCVRGMVRGREKGLAVVFPQVPEIFGAPGRIRTPGQELRRLLLYPPELRARAVLIGGKRLSVKRGQPGHGPCGGAGDGAPCQLLSEAEAPAVHFFLPREGTGSMCAMPRPPLCSASSRGKFYTYR